MERIALFLGSALTDEQLADVVKHATFNNMKKNPQANYERVPGRLLSHHQGTFLRKGEQGHCCRCMQEEPETKDESCAAAVEKIRVIL